MSPSTVCGYTGPAGAQGAAASAPVILTLTVSAQGQRVKLAGPLLQSGTDGDVRAALSALLGAIGVARPYLAYSDPAMDPATAHKLPNRGWGLLWLVLGLAVVGVVAVELIAADGTLRNSFGYSRVGQLGLGLLAIVLGVAMMHRSVPDPADRFALGEIAAALRNAQDRFTQLVTSQK